MPIPTCAECPQPAVDTLPDGRRACRDHMETWYRGFVRAGADPARVDRAALAAKALEQWLRAQWHAIHHPPSKWPLRACRTCGDLFPVYVKQWTCQNCLKLKFGVTQTRSGKETKYGKAPRLVRSTRTAPRTGTDG